jgi:hypothetical protein
MVSWVRGWEEKGVRRGLTKRECGKMEIFFILG